MAYEHILVEREGPITIVTLNRPQVFNALHKPAHFELEDAFDKFSADPDQWVAIVTGAGDKAFSAGNDLKYQAAGGERGWGKSGFGGLVSRFDCDKPIIAAVNGPAIGAGLDLATMCDIRIAGESAKFAESFVKVGIVPGDGGAWLLPRIVGFSRATELALTGEMFDAQTALAYGLVSHVVPDDQLLTKAMDIALKIAANPPHAVRMTKRLLREGQTATLANILEMSAAMQSLAHATKDNDEAIDAFIEKRAPVFRGE
mgnify:CR=1 FL=1